MNRSLLVRATIAVALVGVSGAALAQLDNSHPIGVSIRAGGFFPIDSSSQNEGSAWVGLGADYKLGEVSILGHGASKGSVYLSFDYFGRGGVSNTPVLINYGGTLTNGLFYDIGAGAGAARLPFEDKVLFTYQVGVGYAFPISQSTPFFLEAKFWGCQQNQLDGVGVYAGVKL